MKIYRFTLRDVLGLLGIFLLMAAFTVTQKFWIPELVRPFALFLVVTAGFYAMMAFVRPDAPWLMARTLSCFFGTLTLLLIAVLHLCLTFNPSWKNVIVLGSVVILPFVAGWLYVWRHRVRS